MGKFGFPDESDDSIDGKEFVNQSDEENEDSSRNRIVLNDFSPTDNFQRDLQFDRTKERGESINLKGDGQIYFSTECTYLAPSETTPFENECENAYNTFDENNIFRNQIYRHTRSNLNDDELDEYIDPSNNEEIRSENSDGKYSSKSLQYSNASSSNIPRNNGLNRLIKWNNLLFLFLAIAWGRYAPPPPNGNSWPEFMYYSSHQIFYGLMGNIYRDIKYQYKKVESFSLPHIYRSRKSTRCQMALPHNNVNDQSLTEEYLLNNIVGQDRAIRKISRLIDAWDISNKHSRLEKIKPLTLLFTGGEGVGKLETAKTLSKILLKNCDEKKQYLEIEGFDFHNYNKDYEDNSDYWSVHMDTPYLSTHDLNRKSFMKSIHDHIQNNANVGSFIVVKHLEYLPTDIVNELAQYIEQRVKEKVIIILTSELGIERVFHSIMKYGSFDNIPFENLQKSIENIITIFFDGFVPNLVVPFAPLQQDIVKIIFGNILKNLSDSFRGDAWSRLEVHASALDYFCSSTYVKYIKLTESDFTFAEKGFNEFDHNPLLQILKAQINRGYFLNPSQIAHCAFDATDKQVVLSWCNDINSESSKQCQEGVRIKP